MTPADLGQVFSHLLQHREVHANPPDRSLRENELEVSRILADAGQADLRDLDEFLAVQGFRLYIRDALEFGIPPKTGRNNYVYVMTRLHGEPLAGYLDKGWVVDELRDGRRQSLKAERVVWLARMWLTLQWFFYERADRLPSEVSRYREPLVSEKLFIDTLSEGIEKMGNAGRPEGKAGVTWDLIWENKERLPVYASRFLRLMETAGMIQNAGNPDEYRQTLVAAVDMAVNAEQELAYLMPPDTDMPLEERTVELITGADYEGEGHASAATD